MADTTPVFDGHNDVLLELEATGATDDAFTAGGTARGIDLPRARAGGLAAGIFALFSPSPGPPHRLDEVALAGRGFDVAVAAGVQQDAALLHTRALIGRGRRLVAAADGAAAIVTSTGELDACLDGGPFGLVLGLEGAEAVGPELDALDELYDAGIRVIGPVWSRPNAFAHGVPFRYPGHPDTGPGLTAAGLALVRRANALGVVLDLAHLNAAGLIDVARASEAPLVVSHTGAHALAPTARNLTDEQLRLVGDSGGVVGVIFAVWDLEPGVPAEDKEGVAAVVRHVRHIADVAGVEHVGLGSDFDGASMPSRLAHAGDLPVLLEALAEAGFTRDEVAAIAHGNWRRVLAATWG
jgi:membrane dipeptidase